MEQKSLVFECKSDAENENVFSGYASIFGKVDSVGDVVAIGAFDHSIKSGRKVKLLWNHDPNKVIGLFEDIREDEKGLFVSGRFAETDFAQDVRKLLLMGAIDSMSIGYKTTDYEYRNDGVRLLKEVALYEISLVTFPANEGANVISAKSIDDENMNSEILALLNTRMKLLS